MPAITLWPTLAQTTGEVVESETWEPLFTHIESAGREPFRGDMKHGGWSAARLDPPVRVDANVVAMTALVLDYDGDGGETIAEAVAMWGLFYGLIHTTRRHTEARHRFRVILPFSREVTPAEYAKLLRYAVKTSGHRVDAKTRNPSRFWFLPGSIGGVFVSERLRGNMLPVDELLAAALADEEEEAQEAKAARPNVTRIHPDADSRADRYARGALEDACNAAGMAAPGTRNRMLFVAACTAGNFIASGLLSEAYALELLEVSARVSGLPPFEARKTIRSGIARGKQSPRQAPEREQQHRRPAGGAVPPADRDPGAAPEPEPSAPSTAPHRLEKYWKTIGEWGFLDRPAPRQRWILMRPDTETNELANPIGLLPRSKLGFLVAEGETGKSFAMMQLALSVATGRKWLEYFIVPEPGRVLLMHGEESVDDAHRRIAQLVATMRLTDEQHALVKQNIVLLPLASELTPLAEKCGPRTVETDDLRFYRQKLEEDGREWALIMIDPLSRFAADETELDNAQATRFIQIAESFCNVPGQPTVLFSHHTKKGARGSDAPEASASDARGASGVTDGGRWCANLVKKDDGVTLKITKNNYAPSYRETIHLERAFGGYLRVQTQAERQRHEHERDVGARQKVIEALTREPGLSKNALRSRVQMKAATLRTLIDEMERDGELYQKPRWCYQVRSGESDA